MKSKNLACLTIIFAVAVFSGCRTNLFSGENAPAAATQTSTSPAAPLVVDGVRASYADVVEKTSPAVVRIESQIRANVSQRQEQPQQQFPFGDDDFFRQFQTPRQNQQRSPVERGVGSGVIVSADGTILTNNHVVEGADKITVELNDNKTYEARLVGADKPSDLAVIKIEGQNLPFLSLGNSDSVRIGDIVLAIGNPLGIGQTVTQGIISAKGRRTGLSDGQSFEDFLQTDAAINRGNSGGALVNLAGELIGINSQILSTTGGSIGIGFSIPSNMAKSVMEQLVQNGRVRRGMLGVNIQNITPEMAQALDLQETGGVLVSNVRPGSAADKAGVKARDIITAINGERIEDSNVLRNKVAGTLPGNPIKLTVTRDGAQQELTATLDEFGSETAASSNNQSPSQNDAAPQPGGKLGVTLQPITPQIAAQLQLPADSKGLIVTEIDPSGAAAEQGITRGDIILEINRQPVVSADDVQNALANSGSKPILVLVSRRGQTIYLTVKPQ